MNRKHTRRRGLILAATLGVAALSLAACSSGTTGGGGSNGPDVGDIVLDPAELQPTEITIQSPDGTTPASYDEVKLSAEDCDRAREGGFTVGLVMHSLSIGVPIIQVRGIEDALNECGVEVIGTTDADFDVTKQTADLENMIQLGPDGIISVPVDGTAMAPAYKDVESKGITLILSDIFPRDLVAGEDFTSLVGSDVRGAGQIAGQVAAAYTPEGGELGLVDFDADFFATNQRTLGAEDWIKQNRPDITMKTVGFTDPSAAGQVGGDWLTANPGIDSLYAVWDAPALDVISAARAQGLSIPVGTVDLGVEVALDMAKGGVIKGIGAQLPYEEGQMQAWVMIKALLGDEVPSYAVVPPLAVVPSNLLDGYRAVWHEEPPSTIVEACADNPACG